MREREGGETERDWLIQLYFSVVKMLAQWPAYKSAVDTVL